MSMNMMIKNRNIIEKFRDYYKLFQKKLKKEERALERIRK